MKLFECCQCSWQSMSPEAPNDGFSLECSQLKQGLMLSGVRGCGLRYKICICCSVTLGNFYRPADNHNWAFLVPKARFLPIRKQQTLNFSYHESSRWQFTWENRRRLKAFLIEKYYLPKRFVGCPWFSEWNGSAKNWNETGHISATRLLSVKKNKFHLVVDTDIPWALWFWFPFVNVSLLWTIKILLGKSEGKFLPDKPI